MRLTNNRNGFTLIELIVAMAVAGLVLSVLVTSIYQTTKVNTQSRNNITALEDISHTAERLAPDIRTAQITRWYNGTGDSVLLQDEDQPVDNLILDWISWYDDTVDPPEINPVDCRIEYTFLAGEGKLQRKYWRHKRSDAEDYPDYWQNYVETNEPTSTTTFGRYISDIEFSRHAVTGGGSYVLMVITSSPEESAESDESVSYRVSLRTMEEVPSYT